MSKTAVSSVSGVSPLLSTPRSAVIIHPISLERLEVPFTIFQGIRTVHQVAVAVFGRVPILGGGWSIPPDNKNPHKTQTLTSFVTNCVRCRNVDLSRQI